MTLEVLTKPSSRGSGRTAFPPRSLFMSLRAVESQYIMNWQGQPSRDKGRGGYTCITHWHRTKPSRNASQNARLSLSSPAALRPLELIPELDTFRLLAELILLIPHTRSNLAKGCIRISTASQSRFACSDLLICSGGRTISLQSIDAAFRTRSRCSGLYDCDIRDADEML